MCSSSAEGNADALRAGTDMACESYATLNQSLTQGLVSEEDINRAVARVLTSKFNLGLFDPPSDVPYTAIGLDILGAPYHRALATEAARKGEPCIHARPYGQVHFCAAAWVQALAWL